MTNQLFFSLPVSTCLPYSWPSLFDDAPFGVSVVVNHWVAFRIRHKERRRKMTATSMVKSAKRYAFKKSLVLTLSGLSVEERVFVRAMASANAL